MEFSRKLKICLFVGLSLKALCVVMAMLTAILLQPIDGALSIIYIQQKFHALDKQIEHLINLSVFMIVVAFFSAFCSVIMTDCCNLFSCFYSYKHFCKSSHTCGSSAHFTNIWYAEKTEIVTVPFEKEHLLNDFFDFLYLKL